MDAFLPTVGVEEEFLLVDPHSGAPVREAGRVLALVDRGGLGPGAAVHPELRPVQVESATGVCTSATELREHLLSGRRELSRAAAARHCALAATGTPSGATCRYGATAEPRYVAVEEAYQGVVGDYDACGCHVHVGVPDGETAVAVVNHLGRWLPTLLALSANSPFDAGRDTGYQSWRMVQQSRFPGAGVAPHFSCFAEYRNTVDTLVECGALVDVDQTFWLARPSAAFPTVELRVADTALTADEALLQGLLSRALVVTALRALDRGVRAEPVDPQLAAAAVWSASRHGLTGPGVDLRAHCRVPATTLVRRLLEHVRDALDDAGDLALVSGLVERVLREGTGATRQRLAAAAGGQAAVQRMAVHAAGVAGQGAGIRSK